MKVSSAQQCAGVFKMLQWHEQKFMTGCRMVIFALQDCLKVDEVTCHNHHKKTDELYSTLHTDKGSVMVIVEVLGCSRSVLFGRHEC